MKQDLLDPALSLEEIQLRLHELEVHQVELEMQNDELRRVNLELETARARNIEFYELAPVGYLSINLHGLVVDANLTAATMLGVSKSALFDQPLIRFISADDQDLCYMQCRRRFATDGPLLCELRMVKADGGLFWARWETAVTKDSAGEPLCRVVMSDITERKLAEEALKDSESRFRAIVRDQTEIISRFNPDGRFTFVNDVYCRFFGKRLDELIGNIWQPLAVAEDIPKIEEALRTLAPDSPVALIENRVSNASGKVHWMQFVNRAFFHEDGSLKEIQSVGRDITDLKMTEEVLRKSEERAAKRASELDATLSAIAEGLMVLDTNLRILRMNRIAEHVFKFTPGEMALPPEKRLERFSVITSGGVHLAPRDLPGPRALRGETVESELLCFKHQGGEFFWASVNAAPIFCERGTITGAVVTFQDITLRRQAEEARAQSENLLNCTQALGKIGGWEFIPATGTIFWTKELYRIFGVLEGVYDPGDYRRNFEFAEKPWQKDLAKAFETLAAEGKPFDMELPITTGDRRDLWVRASGAAEFKDGTIVRVFGNIMDITEHKRAEQFRADVERIIRHDIKTPLETLHTLAEYALDDRLDEAFRAAMPDLLHSIRNVINLVDSSEKIVKMENGEYTPLANWLNLRKIVSFVELSLAPLAKSKGIRLTSAGMLARAMQQEQPVVYGEEFLLEEMLTNLVKNALEASPEDCEVTISCHPGQGGKHVVIHNTGAVPESMRDRFFDKYATEGKPHGKGLGTYSAQLIAAAHGGKISFSTSEEEGTTITVVLPAQRPLQER